MTGEVIKSFLVGLGFDVDDASLSKFNKAIDKASLRVAALYGSINAATTGIVYGLSKISEGFEQMGYEYHIIAPAVNKALVLRRELLKAYSAAGINITKVIRASIRLNMSLAKTKFAFEAIYRSVGSRFFGLLTKQSDLLRQKLYANLPKIQKVLENLIHFIFKAFDATVQLGIRLWSILSRVYDFFVVLDNATNGWSTTILGLVAAWNVLNLAFLATPLGLIITGLIAILALYDDFKTFQEGGKSFFDWSSAIPVVYALKENLQSIWSVLQAIGTAAYDVYKAFKLLFDKNWSGAFDSLIFALDNVIDVFFKLWDAVKSNLGFTAELFKWASLQFGGIPQTGINSQIPNVTPLGVGGAQTAQTNQHVQQQTSIQVIGSADANAVGKAVAGEQNNVNFNLTRNLKGATR